MGKCIKKVFFVGHSGARIPFGVCIGTYSVFYCFGDICHGRVTLSIEAIVSSVNGRG